ncbi:hypothetical protein O6H91_23G001000 [Diphasiastrum complanatum]|uniref:Uncharacterized protein n=1 Tax=Diphasiastrum complanatum TaxID=34168 RepID=A0ACC2A7U3_DIPCM|nr:hypothetical protein O6H91_23G001000 [Diphasiastrum complanatum]
MASPESLYLGSMVVGIGYGVRLAISVPIASKLFGLKNFDMLYNFLILNISLSSFLFSGLLQTTFTMERPPNPFLAANIWPSTPHLTIPHPSNLALSLPHLVHTNSSSAWVLTVSG